MMGTTETDPTTPEPQPDPDPCFICGRPATRTTTSFEGTATTVELCDDCNPYDRGDQE
jgi:ribosome-binding protein aMBF1 (putative translation factor)